jgi:hypothetical protein
VNEEVKVRTVYSPRNVEVQTARYDDVSKVEIDRGMTFADLKIKTRGLLRGETLQVRGLGVGRTPNAPKGSSRSGCPHSPGPTPETLRGRGEVLVA